MPQPPAIAHHRRHLVLLPGGAASPVDDHREQGTHPTAADDVSTDARRVVAGDVARLLAGLAAHDVAPESLALPLGLSVCMARHRVGADDLIGALRLLRETILSVAGLDPATEPVPLAAGEPKVAALQLAPYLHDLLCRAARATAGDLEGIASSAAAELRAS